MDHSADSRRQQQMFGIHLRGLAENHGPLDHVSQFAHVPGPMAGLQRSDRLGREGGGAETSLNI